MRLEGRIHGARRLGRVGQSVANQLALWREETAQSQDRPREWILHSEGLLAIAARLPESASTLENIPKFSVPDRRRWSSAILARVEIGVEAAADYQPMTPYMRPSTEQKRTEQLLWKCLKVVCETADIPTAAVATRDDIRKLACGDSNIQLLQGWRRRFVGRDLQSLAAQEDDKFRCQ